MECLVYTGKIIYFKSSDFARWSIAQANEQAQGCSFRGLVSEQSLHNLGFRHLELEVLKRIDEVWLGPGNQAPESYAW